MATECSLAIVVGVDIAVSNIEVFSAATGLQQRVRFAQLQSYKIFLSVVDNMSLNIMNVFLYSCLIIDCAERMHHVILSSVVCLALTYPPSPTLPHKLQDFRGTKI